MHTNDLEELTADDVPVARSLTVASEPPRLERPQQRAFWADLLAECREVPDEWHRTVMTFSRSTASQIASDIRNVRGRDLSKIRIRGVLPGDVWDAQPGKVSEIDGVHRFAIWLKYQGRR